MGLCGGDVPDPAKETQKAQLLDLELLPLRREIEAAATSGGRVNIGGADYDFSGLGEADFQRAYADKLAQTLLDLQREHGAEFVQQRLEELQRADPEGFGLRKQLFDKIMGELEQAGTGDRTESAQRLQDSILGELERGGELPQETARRISQSVLGEQVARGNYQGNAPATQEATALVSASEGERARRQQSAIEFLTSGASPEDVRAREIEQAMANLGAFTSGETPEAQFGQLQGAQSGAVPFYPVAEMAGVNPGAGQAGASYALAAGRLEQNNVNPWLAGISGAFQGANIWASMGGSFGGGGGSNGITWAGSAPAYAANGSAYGPN